MSSRYFVEFARTMSTTELLNVMLSNIEYVLGKMAEEIISEKGRVKTGLEQNHTKLELVNINTESVLSKQSTYTLYAECNPKPEEAFEKWQLRQIKSWRKFCNFVEANFEYLYDDEVVTQLCAKYMDLPDIEDLKELKKRSPMSCVFYEGFIMEGKSSELMEKAKYDSEADIFWRNTLIDGSTLAHKYYKIFIWYSIFKHFFARIASKDQVFYLDRCYMSQLCFELVANEWEDIPPGNLAAKVSERNAYFKRLYTNFVCICAKSDCALFEINYLKNRDAPWPFKDDGSRDLEKELYPSELTLNKAYLNFYSLLDNTFSNIALTTEPRVHNAFQSSLTPTGCCWGGDGLIKERTELLKRKRNISSTNNNALKKTKQN